MHEKDNFLISLFPLFLVIKTVFLFQGGRLLCQGVSNLLPPGVPEHKRRPKASGTAMIAKLAEAALQADVYGPNWEITGKFSKDKEEVFNHC